MKDACDLDKKKKNLRGGLVRDMNSSVLIHLPFGFSSHRGLPFVEHHGFLHSNDFVIRRVNIARRTCCFPIPTSCGSAGSPSPGFPLLTGRKEKPLLRVSTTKLPSKC